MKYTAVIFMILCSARTSFAEIADGDSCLNPGDTSSVVDPIGIKDSVKICTEERRWKNLGIVNDKLQIHVSYKVFLDAALIAHGYQSTFDGMPVLAGSYVTTSTPSLTDGGGIHITPKLIDNGKIDIYMWFNNADSNDKKNNLSFFVTAHELSPGVETSLPVTNTNGEKMTLKLTAARVSN